MASIGISRYFEKHMWSIKILIFPHCLFIAALLSKKLKKPIGNKDKGERKSALGR